MPPFSNDNTLAVKFPGEHAEPCLSPSKGPLHQSQRKSVNFNERVRAKKCLHYTDFSDEEVKAYWYTEEDFKTMKNAVRFEVNLLENGCLDPNTTSTQYCCRGLENFTPEGIKRRMSNKNHCFAVVLEEQHLQREEGSFDQEYIAEIYEKAVASARRAALVLALQDRADAMR